MHVTTEMWREMERFCGEIVDRMFAEDGLFDESAWLFTERGLKWLIDGQRESVPGCKYSQYVCRHLPRSLFVALGKPLVWTDGLYCMGNGANEESLEPLLQACIAKR